MSDDEVKSYLTALALGTAKAIMARCKASFGGDLDATRVNQIERANRRASQQPGQVLVSANAQARVAFERAYPGKGGGIFAEVLQGDLAKNMRRSRDETLKGCKSVIALWAGKIDEGAWEETLATFGASTFARDQVRRRPAFPRCK